MGTRKIIFRGRRLDNGEWVYGSLMQIEDTYFIIEPIDFSYNNDTDATAFWFDSTEQEVDPATVGLCTGMCDKNGNDIYEGDILSDGGIPGIVEWDSLLLQFHCAWANFDFKTSGDIFYLLRRNYVAIGNIHDNPELIKTE